MTTILKFTLLKLHKNKKQNNTTQRYHVVSNFFSFYAHRFSPDSNMNGGYLKLKASKITWT